MEAARSAPGRADPEIVAMGSLQEALLKTGLAEDRPKSEPGPRKSRETRRHTVPQPRPGKSSPGVRKTTRVRNDSAVPAVEARQKSDLERAWAARKRAEAAEKERVKQARVADQEARRKRNLALDAIVEGKALNIEDAELPRYFEHLGRIRRVLCTPEQRQLINSGALGVVNLRGRYLIVGPDVLEAYRALAADLVPDLSGKEPEAEADGDYPPVPDDITW
jgi:uncharacterized protein YaiL (DUF2058 family)